MSMNATIDVRIDGADELPSPLQIRREIAADGAARHAVQYGRETVEAILDGADPRLLMVVGPCSIHDPEGAGLEFAKRLAALSDELSDRLFLVMRVCFAKPRASLDGWAGLVCDPYMDGSFRMDQGLRKARRFLVSLAEMGLPAGVEFVNPVVPQYLGDLVSWACLGSRTTESMEYRNLASGLSMPVGFKNATDGSVEETIGAIHSAMRPFRFLGVSEEGRLAVLSTKGNPYSHLVMRGGHMPNYQSSRMAEVERLLEAAKVSNRVLVDCAHANSEWNPNNQETVLRDGLRQIEAGDLCLAGFILESHLNWGRQPILREPSFWCSARRALFRFTGGGAARRPFITFIHPNQAD